jgi:hypothetical protein
MSWKFDDLRFGVEAFVGNRIPARVIAFVYKVFFIEFPLELGLSGPRLMKQNVDSPKYPVLLGSVSRQKCA